MYSRGCVWFAKSFSCLTQLNVMLGRVVLWLSWGFDNIANIEFVWWGGGVVCKIIFMSNPTLGYVSLSWVVVELGFWQQRLRPDYLIILWLKSTFLYKIYSRLYSYRCISEHMWVLSGSSIKILSCINDIKIIVYICFIKILVLWIND